MKIQSELQHFLVVDDDRESQQMIVEYLRTAGFKRVTLAQHGLEALELLNQDITLNFIISDWKMPQMNGLTLLQRVKLDPLKCHIPFLVVTSPISSEAEKIDQARKNWVDGYLIKPFRYQIFTERIHRILLASALGFKKHVVILESDLTVQKKMENDLRQMGIRFIQCFTDGEATLRHLWKEFSKVGLIISGWGISSRAGVEFKRICQEDSDLKKIPFLLKPDSIENFEESIKGILHSFSDPAIPSEQEIMESNPAIAIPSLEKAIANDRLDVSAYIKLARLYEDGGEDDRAIEVFRNALISVTHAPDIHYELGLLYYGKGLLHLSKIEFEKTLELQFDHKEARLMLEVTSMKGS